MKRLNSSYQSFTNRVKSEIGNINATYGLSGNATLWKSGSETYMNGGAEQIVAPFTGDVLDQLGILVEKK